MQIGQISYPYVSKKANYVQLDICGLDVIEAELKYEKYNNLPIILHGDWSKKGCSENNLWNRLPVYIEIVRKLSKRTSVLGFTLHPPSRNKMSADSLLEAIGLLNSHVPVFLENRSNPKLHCSLPEEVIEYSSKVNMTIDIPQLYIACNYNMPLLMSTLKRLDYTHVIEVHLANIKRDGSHTYVGRKLDDGILPLLEMQEYLKKVNYITLEILGGVPTFNKQQEQLRKFL